MTDRLARAHDRLRRIPGAYERGLRALSTVGPSSARYDGSHGSGPRSRTPAGRDVELRTALVRALRALADAHAELRGTIAAPWHPLRLGSRSGPVEVDTWRGEVSEPVEHSLTSWKDPQTTHDTAVIHDDGSHEGHPTPGTAKPPERKWCGFCSCDLWWSRPLAKDELRVEHERHVAASKVKVGLRPLMAWNPPDDSDSLALDHPDTVRSACGLLGARLDDPAPDDERRFHACRMVDRAVGVLKAAGVWEWPDGARHVSERCANFPACPGWRKHDRTECAACVTRRYRRRKRTLDHSGVSSG